MNGFSTSTGSSLLTPVSIANGGTGSTSASAARLTLGLRGWVNVKTDHSALGDGRYLTDLATTNGAATVTSASANFTAADIGKKMCVVGAGASGAPLVATISSINSTTSVVVGINASATLTSRRGLVGTDDTAAFQAALDALGTAGGGTLFVPDGVYLIAGAIQTPSGVASGYGRAQLVLPTRNLSTQAEISIQIEGTTPPAPNTNWTTDTPPLSTGGAVLQSYQTAATATHAILGGGPPAGAIWAHSGIRLGLRNLTFRTYNVPAISALYLKDIGQVDLENILVDTGTVLANVSEPSAQTFGAAMPGVSNWVTSRIKSCDFIGYYTGVQFNEHFVGDDVRVWLSKIGYQTTQSPHPSTAGKLTAVGCERVIKAIGSTTFLTIDLLDVEHTAFGDWRDTDFDIDDGSNLLRGTVNFHSVESNIGPLGVFTRLNGNRLLVRNLYGPHDAETIQAFGNGTMTVDVGTTLAKITGTLTAPRTMALPSAAIHRRLQIVDETGTVNATNTVTISPSGSDTGGNHVLARPYETVTLLSDGVSKWTPVSAPNPISKYAATDVDRQSTTTLTDDPALTAILKANTSYHIEMNFSIQAQSGTPGVRYCLNSTQAIDWGLTELINHSALEMFSRRGTAGSGSLWGPNERIANHCTFKIAGTVRVGATDTVLSVQWAQNTSEAVNLRRYLSANLTATPL